jgi:malate dehydrogenase
VTTLDICRANRFIADAKGVDPRSLNVPVIGGHAGKTILPLLSQTVRRLVGTPATAIITITPRTAGLQVHGQGARRAHPPHPGTISRLALTDNCVTVTLVSQFGGDEVVQAKAGAGSATLSMAYAGFVFAENVLKAAKGENVTMCT